MELEGWDKLVEINLNGVLYCMRAVLPAMRKQKDGCIINVASWAGRHVSKMPGPAYTTTKHAVLALTHSFNMDECVNGLRACCLSPGEVATPILKLRPVVPSEAEQAQDAAAGRLRPHHRLRRQHAAAGLHERDPDQPDLEPRFYRRRRQQGLELVGFFVLAGVTATACLSTLREHADSSQSESAGRRQFRRNVGPRTDLATCRGRTHTYRAANSFKHHDKLFSETARKPSRNSANGDAV